MRIAIFTETFLPKIDGVVNTLCYLLDYLGRHQHHSLLFSPRSDLTHYARTPIIQFSGWPIPIYPELQFVPPTVPVRTHLALFKPQLVHLVSPISLGAAGLWHARRLGIPVVASYHTDIPGFAQRWGMPFLRDPFWNYVRWIHNQADLNLCPSQTTMRELQDQRFQRVKLWTRGVDTHRFNPEQRTRNWRNRLSGGAPDKPLLLFVSRLSPEKQAHLLRPILDAFPECRLAIVGDGPARSELEALFHGTNTVFTGYLRGHDLARAYAAADMFVFPAANETLGNVVLEAMASGLPVITARAGGPLDLVQEGETGLFFTPDDQEALLTAVHHLLKNPDLARQMGHAGREQAQTRSWDAIFDTLIKDYQSVITRHENARRERPRRLVVGKNFSN